MESTCKYCGQTFPSKGAMMIHVRRNCTEKPQKATAQVKQGEGGSPPEPIDVESRVTSTETDAPTSPEVEQQSSDQVAPKVGTESSEQVEHIDPSQVDSNGVMHLPDRIYPEDAARIQKAIANQSEFETNRQIVNEMARQQIQKQGIPGQQGQAGMAQGDDLRFLVMKVADVVGNIAQARFVGSNKPSVFEEIGLNYVKTSMNQFAKERGKGMGRRLPKEDDEEDEREEFDNRMNDLMAKAMTNALEQYDKRATAKNEEMLRKLAPFMPKPSEVESEDEPPAEPARPEREQYEHE